MTPTEAIEALDGMDRQMIHAKRRIFREIANVIRGLVKITPEPPEGMELMRVDMTAEQWTAYAEHAERQAK